MNLQISAKLFNLKPMIVLAIDTVTRYPSISLVEDDHVLCERDLTNEIGSSDNLISQIVNLLSVAGIRVSDLGLIVPVTGPGSFTGVRIGLAAAAGISYANKIPMCGVTSFDMYYQALGDINSNSIICIDSKRSELFFKVNYSSPSSKKEIYSFSINKLDSFFNLKNEKFTCFGDSCDLLKKENINMIYNNKIIKSPHAAFCAASLIKKELLRPSLDVPDPFYFRDADVSQSKKEIRHIAE